MRWLFGRSTFITLNIRLVFNPFCPAYWYNYMSELIGDLILKQAASTPSATAILYKEQTVTYEALLQQAFNFKTLVEDLGVTQGERVAIYLPKVPETVFSIFGAALAGAVFVPINPLLKPQQVAYILKDCNVRALVTSQDRLKLLSDCLADCHDLRSVIVTGKKPLDDQTTVHVKPWRDEPVVPPLNFKTTRIDKDIAAILYTSGSTGNPKGVVLSHHNLIAGAKSVSSYLENTAADRLLAVMPFSFDYGLSQLTTAFHVGASVVLMDYLLPRDVIRAVEKYQITGLAAVPPLWTQLADLEWPMATVHSLRYLTNTGGAMPITTTKKLTAALPDTKIFLMYGLTEAFRSTYLPPEQVHIRPDSMGKAIPNAEVLVLREDGSECAPGEPGELVHRGALVSMGYWNDPVKTAERFKPIPGYNPEVPLTDYAVWSGDQVKKDEEGYLYFISRKDEMIKTSGYRVSPTEIEEVLYASQLVSEVAALGIQHPVLGQAIVLIAVTSTPDAQSIILKHCQKELPNFMLPKQIILVDKLPRNPNGKIDRKQLGALYSDLFLEA